MAFRRRRRLTPSGRHDQLSAAAALQAYRDAEIRTGLPRGNLIKITPATAVGRDSATASLASRDTV